MNRVVGGAPAVGALADAGAVAIGLAGAERDVEVGWGRRGLWCWTAELLAGSADVRRGGFPGGDFGLLALGDVPAHGATVALAGGRDG